MILFKDTKTNKKSLTVTGLFITFNLTVASVVINLILLINKFPTETGMIWACIGFMSPFAAIYWNKRVRASSSGIDIGVDNGTDS